MTPSSSYQWIREIKPELKQLDQIPLTGASPPFPWNELGEKLAQSFEKERIQIEPSEIQWRSKQDLYEGFGDSLFPLFFSIPSFRGTACWVMPEQEMAALEALLLTKDSHPIYFQDRALSESFYRFLALEVLYNLSQVHFDPSIAPILLNEQALPQEDSLCLDISMHIQGQTLWGRLIISPEMRTSWVEHFSKLAPSALTQEISKQVDVILHIEAGKTALTLKQWSDVNLGDFIILDQCSLDKEDLNGRVALTLHGKNIFRAKLKDGNIKILEFPLYQEVETPMPNKFEDEHEDDEFNLSDEDFEFDENFEELDEEHPTQAEEQTDIDIESEPQAAAQPQKPSNETQPVQQAGSRAPISPEQITVSLIVEVGRLQISVQKLMELEPGNLLELDVHPEDGVNLVINGKTVGRGELVRIGENLGVRVLELGQ
jgi:flagellar motor switch protein FliN